MTFEKYKKIFEEILALSIQIKDLYQDNKSDEAVEIFAKRNELLAKLGIPDDIDQSGFDYICSIKNQIEETNNAILKLLQVQKNKVAKQFEDNVVANQTEEQLKETYKNPKNIGDDGSSSSIFGQK